jgi:adenosylmethionine---8-amino-7-oxononanoate aminotransferase
MGEEHIWHPFTQMKLSGPPVRIVRANGTILFGEDGREYIDAISSWWVNIHGHCNPFIAEKIAAQARTLEHVIFAGFTHDPAITLAGELIRMLGRQYSRVFFSDNGSTAVEVALKMALQYWHNIGVRNRIRVLAFENAYHGDTFGAMSVGAASVFNEPFESLLFEVDRIPLPDVNNIDAVIGQVKELLRTDEVAAFIFEPLVQGAGGMNMYQAEHLGRIIREVKSHGVLCIADEVMTGFGRTGKLFATDYVEEDADIICLSKGITGGFMPLGVTICTSQIYDAFYSDDMRKTFFHAHSYTANPLACAAAVASMELLRSEECQHSIQSIAGQHAAFMPELSSHSLAANLRQCGTILALDIQSGGSSSYLHPVGREVYHRCLDQGVLLRPLGNVLYILPPYCITASELDKVYEVIIDVLDKLKV